MPHACDDEQIGHKSLQQSDLWAAEDALCGTLWQVHLMHRPVLHMTSSIPTNQFTGSVAAQSLMIRTTSAQLSQEDHDVGQHHLSRAHFESFTAGIDRTGRSSLGGPRIATSTWLPTGEARGLM